MKIFLMLLLVPFLAFSQEDVFDLEEGAVKKVKIEKIPTLNELEILLQKGSYLKFSELMPVSEKKYLESDQKFDFRKLKLSYQLSVGLYDDALKDLENSPLEDDETSFYLHCSVLLKKGKYGVAKTLAEKGIKAFPESCSLTYILYEVASLTGDVELDSLVWTKVKKLYSKSRSGREGKALDIALLGRCVQIRSPQKAYTLFQRAYKKDPQNAQIYVWAGNHCSKKYEWNFSMEELSKALKINPQHAEAKAALAYVLMEKGDYQKARELVAEALSVNPNCSEAQQLLSMIYLVDDKKKDSWKVLEHALSVNGQDLAILSQMAAAYHQESKFTQRDEFIERVLKINPRYSKVYLAIAQSCEDLRQFPEAVAWAKKGILKDPRDWEGYFISGMNLLRLGEETEGYKTLDKAFGLNGFNIWARNILVLLDRDFKKNEFRQFETEHFVIKLHRSESEVMFPYLAKVVEDAYEKYTKKYDIKPVGPKEYKGKILLLMFDKHNDFSARTVGLPGLGALGACFGQIITMPSPIIGKDNDNAKFHWKRVFEHEFIHVLTLQKSSYYVPRWLTEGISTWEEGDPQSEVDRQLQWAWKNGQLLPLESINSGFSQQSYPNQIGVSYYHASLVCRYLNDEYGFEVIQKMLELFRAGKSNEVVLSEATGKSLSELNREVKAYLDAYISKIPLTTPMPEKEVLELANKYNSFGLPLEKQLDLAAGYIRTKKKEEARKVLTAILAEHPKNVRGLNMSAMLFYHAEDKEAAKKVFAQVIELAPNHYVANYFLAMMAGADEDTALAINYYEAALKQYARVEPGRNNIYFKLVEMHDALGASEKSLDVLRRHTVNNNKNFAGFVKYGDRLIEFKKPEDAAKALLEANHIYPFDFDVHQKLAILLVELEDFVGAEREYKVGLELQPRNKEALMGLYKLYLKQSDSVKADEVLVRLKRFYPDDDFSEF